MKSCCKCKALYTPFCERSFYAFPTDIKLKKKWLEILDVNVDNLETLYLCSDHFNEGCYEVSDEGHNFKRLRIGALPIGSESSNQEPYKHPYVDVSKDRIIAEANGNDIMDTAYCEIDELKTKTDICTSLTINDEQSLSGHFIESIEIKVENVATNFSTEGKQPAQSARSKRFKLTDGHLNTYFSRADFSSEESWNKFLRYKEHESEQSSDKSITHHNKKKISKLKQVINNKKNHLKVCRICLATDCRMYLISEHKLIEAYQLITGLQIEESDRLPKMLCVECAHRLANYNKFRDKCLRANKMMLKLCKDKALTLKTCRNVDREACCLTSDLTSHVYINLQENENNELVKDEETKMSIAKDDLQVEVKQVKLELEMSPFDDNDDLSNDAADKDGADDQDRMKDDYLSNPNVSDPSLTEYEIDHSDKSVKTEKIVVMEFLPDRSKLKLTEGKKTRGRKRKVIEENVVDTEVRRKRKVKSTNPAFDAKFTVKDLTHEEQVAEVLKRKESDNYRKANFICDKCFRGFADKKPFENHMKRHTDASGAIECAVCFMRFKTARLFKKHSNRHQKMYSCNICDFKNSDRTIAVNHYKWHKGVQFTCPHCNEVFKKSTTYFSHLRIKHPSDFICQLCGYSFISQKGVLAHQKLSHELDGTKQEIPLDGPMCDTCDIRFASTEAYDNHLQVAAKHTAHHQGQDDSTMPINDYTQGKLKKRNVYTQGKVVKRALVKKRMMKRSSSQEGPIVCEQCGLELPNGRAYYHHFRVNHPGKNRTRFVGGVPSMCELCGKVFRIPSQLREHILVHEGHQFVCKVCGKVVTSKIGLKQHEVLHLPNKPRAQCSVCGKYFSSIPNMRRHKMLHTGVKPFKCDMCYKSFSSKELKVQHQAHIHLKKPWPKRERGKPAAQRKPTRQDASDDTQLHL